MTPKEALDKLEKPKGRWGKILATTPIVMTVLATVFAGLSSSEMTQAMFHRSLASQQQSKAGDQWAFFQAKRIRGTTLEANIELLQALAHATSFNIKQIQSILDQLEKTLQDSAMAVQEKQQALTELKTIQEKLTPLTAPETAKYWEMLGEALPKVDLAKLPDAGQQKQLDAALEAILLKKSEPDIYQLVRPLTPAVIEEATHLAEKTSEQFSQACDPTAEFGKRLKSWLMEASNFAQTMQEQLPPAELNRKHAVHQLERLVAGGRVSLNDFDARRYRQESFHNRKVAELYEVRVWRSGMESDRHRNRSQLFFYSMLVAQVGVTISSLALAQAKRNALWFVAAFAGIIALSFSAWVYLSW